ncbi:hypothetical protein K504DRAFT_505142 [Pleomassaria siparia CBS 279.74]|uniref:Uncharacterized protein n=1 Tax=Pleomassaria siparia CBS 279.74 TaxID=1314801 RepID=A0A6G1K0P8_9PLEO|nr:hypothetical protein K504DRAFT_505142 [Pleomassaria siparia CBS 279.74]
MDEATLTNYTSEHTTPPTLSMSTRNSDPLTLRLRSRAPVGINELIYIQQVTSPGPATAPGFVTAPSSGTPTRTVFSSHEASENTKPTSTGTSYPVEGYTGKGKATATYASSLSATHGSASEAEADMDTARDEALVGVGDWMDGSSVTTTPLRTPARAVKGERVKRGSKHKKPIVIHEEHLKTALSDDEASPAVAKPEARHNNSRDTKYLRQRRHKPNYDQLHLAEEGRFSGAALAQTWPANPPLSRARSCVLISLSIAMLLTFALSVFAAHYTGKARTACTEGIIFSAAIILSCFTVLAMMVARRALHEALLAGLFEFLVGFALVVKIHDFM